MEEFLVGVMVGMNTTVFITVLFLLNEFFKEKRKEKEENGKNKE